MEVLFGNVTLEESINANVCAVGMMQVVGEELSVKNIFIDSTVNQEGETVPCLYVTETTGRIISALSPTAIESITNITDRLVDANIDSPSMFTIKPILRKTKSSKGEFLQCMVSLKNI